MSAAANDAAQEGELAARALPLFEDAFGPVTVSRWQRLAGSERSVVLRVFLEDHDGQTTTAVLKAHLRSHGGALRESAALGLLADHGVSGVSGLLAQSPDGLLMLLADAGRGPTLATRLLGEDPVAAERALLGWATSLGRLHAATVGLRSEFTRRLSLASPLGTPPSDTSDDDLAGACRQLRSELPQLGVKVPQAALEELGAIVASLEVAAPGAPGAISPADTCPDNNVETASGVVLLDFEGAQYRHLAWDAAYPLVPWPSCWCAWDLPPAVAEAALERWRSEVAGVVPAVREPAFDDALALARTAWAFISTGWLLQRALQIDNAPISRAHPRDSPGRRAVLQHRMLAVVRAADSATPHLNHLAAAIHSATTMNWGTRQLPLAPAFR